jgi:hypothetical protein
MRCGTCSRSSWMCWQTLQHAFDTSSATGTNIETYARAVLRRARSYRSETKLCLCSMTEAGDGVSCMGGRQVHRIRTVGQAWGLWFRTSCRRTHARIGLLGVRDAVKNNAQTLRPALIQSHAVITEYALRYRTSLSMMTVPALLLRCLRGHLLRSRRTTDV